MDRTLLINTFIRVKKMLYYCREQYKINEHLNKQEFNNFTDSFFWPAFIIAIKEGTANDLILNTKPEEIQRLLHKYENIQ